VVAKKLQIRWLEITEIYCLMVLEPRTPESLLGKFLMSVKSLGNNPFLPLPRLYWLPEISAFLEL
jgi:hypothetical protein